MLNLLQLLHQRQYSEELTFTSKGAGPFSSAAGTLYFREEIGQDAVYIGTRNLDAQTAESYAVFGEGRYAIGDGVNVFAGARYTRDKKSLTRQFANPSTVPLASLGTGYFDGNKVTPRAGLEWQVDPRFFVYATYAKGYLPGGFAQPRPTSPIGALATFNSESVDSYEGGVRTTLLDRRLTFNVTGFYSKINNLSQGVLNATSFFVVTGDAEFRGIEIEAAAHPLAGPYLKHDPDHSGKAGVDYTVPIGSSAYSLFVGGNVAHTGRIWRNAADSVNILTEPYTVLDAQIGVLPTAGKWKLTLSGDNLTNQAYIEQGVSSLGRYYDRPRAISLTLDTTF